VSEILQEYIYVRIGKRTLLSPRYMRPTLTTDIVRVHCLSTSVTTDIDDRQCWPVCSSTQHCRPSKCWLIYRWFQLCHMIWITVLCMTSRKWRNF